MHKYRRVVKKVDSKLQSYQFILMALGLFSFLTVTSATLFIIVPDVKLLAFSVSFFKYATQLLIVLNSLLTGLFLFFYKQREQVSTLEIEPMSTKAKKLSKKLLKLFNDKQLSDVLKLSNPTRYGDEMPLIYIWVDNDCSNGYLAIENIANFERMDKEKYEQKMSGMFSGKFKRFAVFSSHLNENDAYMIFNFEDMQSSNRLIVSDSMDSLAPFVCDDVHAICLSKDLTWHSDMTPHLSIIARTRAGKSVLAGRYMARLMTLQGWTVEYNSAKYDRYVKEFNGKNEVTEIVERAEFWYSVMLKRLDKINEADKEKYLEMPNMNNIAIFFDEIGNLNAELEMNKKLKTRWETTINKLSATGGSAGIHIIAISQFATKEGFLPSLARVNCSDAVIMLAGAADSADERKYLMAGFADLPKRNYGKGQGLARIISSDKKWSTPHFYETPWFK